MSESKQRAARRHLKSFTAAIALIAMAGMSAGAVAAAAAGTADAGFPLPEDWRHWRHSAPVEAPPGHRGLTAVVVSPEVTAHAQPDWVDLRVLDDDGREVPFVLYAARDRHSEQQREARLLEVSFLPDESTQGIVDLGAGPAEHNAVEVQIGQPDYFYWAEVAVSRDGASWRIVNPQAPVYRFQDNALDGNQTIRYTPSRSRYLRVRILHGDEMLPLRGVRVTQEIRRDAERVPLTVAVQPDPAAPPDESWWLADLGPGRLPVSEIRFAVDQPAFHRAVRVRASEDGTVWRTVGFGDIYRIGPETDAAEDAAAAATAVEGPAAGGPAAEDHTTESTPSRPPAANGRERLQVRVSESQARFWRVEIIDRNDPQLTGASVQLLGTPRRVVFRAEADRSYRLLMGHPRASAPYYDMARLTPEADLEAAAPAGLGPIAVNPAWADPAPWTERNPYLPWIALLLAAAILIPLALRALRGS